MGNPSFFFPSLCFVCIVSYPFTVSHSACLFSLWPFTRYLKTGIKLFLYYLFLRLNKADSPRHKDSTPDAASQVSNTVKKENFLPPGSSTFVWSYLSTARPQCNLYSIYCPPEFPGNFNGPAFFFQVVPQFVLLYWVNFVPVSEFHIHLCWTSQSFCQPIPETCQDLSEDLPCSPTLSINYGPNLMLSISSLRVVSVSWSQRSVKNPWGLSLGMANSEASNP